MEHVAKISSSVIFVAELDRSVEFYSAVFACKVAILDVDAALLLSSDGFQLYLVAKGHRAQHALGGIGPQYLIWAVDNAESRDHFEQVLKDRGVRTDTHTSGGVEFVTGHDPDGIRVVIAHPSPHRLPRSVMSPRIYGW
jgi:hypothetical protein